jgi:hypothetical protein
VQIQNIKVLCQLLCVDQVGSRLGIIVATLPFDLLDDELGVTPKDRVVLSPKMRASHSTMLLVALN